jgi:hypothetical protein
MLLVQLSGREIQVIEECKKFDGLAKDFMALVAAAKKIKLDGKSAGGQEAIGVARLIFSLSSRISIPLLFYAYRRLDVPLDWLSSVIDLAPDIDEIGQSFLDFVTAERAALGSGWVPEYVRAAEKGRDALTVAKAKRTYSDARDDWYDLVIIFQQLDWRDPGARDHALSRIAGLAPLVGCPWVECVATHLREGFRVLFADRELKRDEYADLWEHVLSLRGRLPERSYGVSSCVWRMTDDLLAWLSRKCVRSFAGLADLRPHLGSVDECLTAMNGQLSVVEGISQFAEYVVETSDWLHDVICQALRIEPTKAAFFGSDAQRLSMSLAIDRLSEDGGLMMEKMRELGRIPMAAVRLGRTTVSQVFDLARSLTLAESAARARSVGLLKCAADIAVQVRPAGIAAKAARDGLTSWRGDVDVLAGSLREAPSIAIAAHGAWNMSTGAYVDFQSRDADRVAIALGESDANFVQARADGKAWTRSWDAIDWLKRPAGHREMRIFASHGNAVFGAAVCGPCGGPIDNQWVHPEDMSTAFREVDALLHDGDALIFVLVMCDLMSIIEKALGKYQPRRVGLIILEEALGVACLSQRTRDGKFVSEGTSELLAILRAIEHGSRHRGASVAACLARASARGGWGRLRFVGPAAIGNLPMCEFADLRQWLADPAPDELFVKHAEDLASPALFGSLDPWIFDVKDIAAFDGGHAGRRTGRKRASGLSCPPAGGQFCYSGSGRDLFREVAAKLDIATDVTVLMLRRAAAIPSCVREAQGQAFCALSLLLRETRTQISDNRVARAFDALVVERGYEVIDALRDVLLGA